MRAGSRSTREEVVFLFLFLFFIASIESKFFHISLFSFSSHIECEGRGGEIDPDDHNENNADGVI